MTLDHAFALIAKSLREFGYPDVDVRTVREIYNAYKAGKDLPHGIVGMFTAAQFKDNNL